MDQYIGKMLENRYEILECIGIGGMAMVYKSRDHRLNRLVAIKILKPELASDAEFRRRFHAESQAVAMLSHPNIVSVYDVSHSNNLDYIVMELIEGITLKQYLEQKGRLNWREALHFSTQIAKALEHAHSRGIIHRDIKPHNIMILKDGSVKVDEKKLDALLAGWKAIADVSNTPFILDTYVDGPKPMNFLKVDYQLDTDALSQQLQQALQKLESKDLRAQLLLYKNGEPYAPLTDVYVEVDIDNQRLTVYKNGEVVTSTDIVTGNLNGFQTITGLYYAYNKETDQWMQGEDYLVFSKYWIGIEGAYGLHDASWRTHFGKDFYVNGGSHGCVNIPVDAMPEIFDTVEVGDAIILFGKNKWFEPDPETTRILQS